MPRLKVLPHLILVIFLAIGMNSCVKDVDFDQAGEIALEPAIQTDLIIFQIDDQDFMDAEKNQQKTLIRDGVRLEFLDDDYIQDNLQEVEFSFRYTNKFPQAFYTRIIFLSENNGKQHEVNFYIGAGSEQNPAVTEKIDYIGIDNIEVIKRSIKMVVEIEALPSEDPFNGELKFESKGYFSFEF